MITVTFCNESYQCAVALKGSDYIKLLDENNNDVATFLGVSDFSGFAIAGGSWTAPKAPTACNVAVVHEDGSVSGCGKPMEQFMTAGEAFRGTIVLSSGVQYGTVLPSTGVEGQLFFKIS